MATPNGTGKPRRIGILGGTFDPVHNAHLAIAEEARKQLGLELVLFLPAGQPWMKSERRITAASQRLAMVRLAIGESPYFALSTIELDREGPTFTVDTLRQLRRVYGEDVRFHFIIGQDALQDFPRWKEPLAIVEMAVLVVAPRPGAPPPDLATLDRRLPGVSSRVIVLPGPHLDISATMVRERVAAGQDIQGLAPEAVEQYIREKGLYRRRA